jgi:hypothetical protein
MMGHTTHTPQKNPASYRTSYATLNEEILSTTPHPAKTKHEKPRKLAEKQANYDSLPAIIEPQTSAKMLANVYPSRRLLLLLLRHKSSNTRYLSQQQRCFPSRNPKTATLNKICGRGADTGKPKKTKKRNNFVTCHEP